MKSDGGGQRGGGIKRTQKSDDDRTRFEQRLVRCAGRVDYGNQVGLTEDGGPITGNRRSCGRIGLIRCSGRFACAGFNPDRDALGQERFEVFRQQSDASFAGSGFLENA